MVLPPALAAALVAAWRRRRALPACLRHPVRHLPPGWGWLIGCAVFGWLLTSLSPNKDARYIAPVLPLLVLVLTMGWWRIGLWLRRRTQRRGGDRRPGGGADDGDREPDRGAKPGPGAAAARSGAGGHRRAAGNRWGTPPPPW